MSADKVAGRYDYSVELDTVDFDMPRPTPGQDPSEFQISRQFIQYIRIAKNVYLSALMYGKLRKKTADWALDPSFVAHNADFSLWQRELPDDCKLAQLPGTRNCNAFQTTGQRGGRVL
jgi:hypothetical protein